MVNTHWNTLAVSDVARARDFYAGLGLSVDEMPGGSGLRVRLGPASMICLFPTNVFTAMLGGASPVEPTSQREVIQSLSLDTPAEVDALCARVVDAGGTLVSPPRAEAWGYTGAFLDPDGHLWTVLSLGSVHSRTSLS